MQFFVGQVPVSAALTFDSSQNDGVWANKAKILRWIDGDTLLVEVDLGFYVKKEEKVRLARINAPELSADVPYQLRLAKSPNRPCKSQSQEVLP